MSNTDTKDFREELIAVIEYYIATDRLTSDTVEDFKGVLETEANNLNRIIAVVNDDNCDRKISQDFEDGMDAYSRNK